MNVFRRRLRVLVDQAVWSRLEREAERRSVSISTLVRDAIAERYPGSATERRVALQSVLQAQLMDVPPPDALRSQRDRVRGGTLI